jgi:hypothetical protein
VPSLKEVAAAALEHPVFAAKSHLVSPQEFDSLRDKIEQLRTASRQISIFLSQVLPPAPPHYFGVRLPDPVSSLEGMQAFLMLLRETFDRPFGLLGHEPVSITSVEPGSLWLEVAVQSTVVLGLVGALLKAGKAFLDVMKSWKDFKATQSGTDVKNRDDQNRLLLQARQNGTEEILKVVEEEFRATSSILASSSRALPAGDEARMVLHRSIQTASSLYGDGLRISVQLDAKVDVVRKFPEDSFPDGLSFDFNRLTHKETPALVPRKNKK